jgi:hypothetical protein
MGSLAAGRSPALSGQAAAAPRRGDGRCRTWARSRAAVRSPRSGAPPHAHLARGRSDDVQSRTVRSRDAAHSTSPSSGSNTVRRVDGSRGARPEASGRALTSRSSGHRAPRSSARASAAKGRGARASPAAVEDLFAAWVAEARRDRRVRLARSDPRSRRARPACAPREPCPRCREPIPAPMTRSSQTPGPRSGSSSHRRGDAVSARRPPARDDSTTCSV